MPSSAFTSIDACLPLLARGRWFAALTPAERQALLEPALLRQLRAGERLFSRGDPPCGLYAVVQGAIRISGAGGDAGAGREALLTLIEGGAWFGEISVFDGRPRTHDAVADGAACVLQVPQTALLELLGRQPALWRALGALMGDKLRLAFTALEDAALLPAPQRLARRLLLMADGYGARSVPGLQRRLLKVSQEQLAQLLSISRQTANQILKGLERQGVLRLQRNGIEILDFARLRAAQEAPPD